jgi:hypothetical protein
MNGMRQILISIAVALIGASAHAQSKAEDHKSSAELLSDLADLSGGNSKARAAVRVAAETGNVDVLAEALKSADYDIRAESLSQVKKLSPRTQRTALLPALQDDKIWAEQTGGELYTIQVLFFRDVVAELKTFGLNVVWQDLYLASARKQIAHDLVALKLPR